MSTDNFGGKTLRKTAIVYTNDPKQNNVKLHISGFVENFVTISPAYVRLNGMVGQPIAVPVTIVPEEKYPFRILESNASDGKNIRYEIKERSPAEGKGYILLIENLKNEKGRYRDVILLKTDSPVKPELSIRVFGTIRAEEKSGADNS